MSASKAQSQKIFEKVKLKPANKVRTPHPVRRCEIGALNADVSISVYRYALIAALKTRPGLQFLSVFTCALIARHTTVTSVCTSPLSDQQTSTVRILRLQFLS